MSECRRTEEWRMVGRMVGDKRKTVREGTHGGDEKRVGEEET